MYWTGAVTAVKAADPLVKIIVVVVLVAGLVAGGLYIRNSIYNQGYEKAELEGEVKLNDFKATMREQFAKQLEQQKAVEDDLRARAIKAQEDKENEVKAINDHYDRIVAGLRTRASRNDPSPSKGTDPSATSANSAGARCTGRELSREDGVFLAREAARAEVLKRKLIECMRNYKALEEKLNTNQ